MGSLSGDVLDELARAGRIDAVRDLLCAAGEAERVAFGPEVAARLRAMRAADWQAEFDPAGSYVLAVLGSAPAAAAAETLLCRRDLRDKWGRVPVGHVLAVLHARKPPWCGELGVRLGARLGGDDPWAHGWQLVAALCAEGGVTPPAPSGVIAGWIGHLQWPGLAASRLVPFAGRLRADPHLDLLLPVVFETDRAGVDLTAADWDPRTKSHVGPPAFPAAVAGLVAEGRLDRGRILSATVARLARGGSATELRAFALLHAALAPTVPELAAHLGGYARMLTTAPAPVAGLAQRCLRAVDKAGLLDLDTVLSAGALVLAGPVKSLAKAQLVWFGTLATREPARLAEILETAAIALDHPAPELRERARTLIEQHTARSGPGAAGVPSNRPEAFLPVPAGERPLS
ncbi:hypothetical protein [Actinoplanes palleronii]|uniref:Secreted protein n=1 Tax=Actinoplanes palleronii TaxID=113570 RepID=A0ABQ4BR41_9ACTN|nr:hypothetical protein [Actinoplanes palleronii]GIE73128.1 hypothetical protein Apa02nite_092360 [Actinoplanes palleronii]